LHQKSRVTPKYKNTIRFPLSAEALAKARSIALAEEGSASFKTVRDVVNRIVMEYKRQGAIE
jgi:hypothetical protein